MILELPTDAFEQALSQFPHSQVFVSVSGSHLYGFPSQDSDFDLRGSHLLPGSAYWGLSEPRETLEPHFDTDAGLVEIVSHDLRKFSRLLLKRNGYVLEQLTSPLVVRTSRTHQTLVDFVPGLLTRNHYHHYRGFYYTERRQYDRSEPRSIKKLLYCYRVLMTGCVLLREGIVEANLQNLNQRFDYPFLDELVERKRAAELGGLSDDTRFTGELEALEAEMGRAFEESTLPDEPAVRHELNALLIHTRAMGVDAG
jgi:uncharacterized protein